MSDSLPTLFDQGFADAYDRRTSVMAPMRGALYAAMRLILADLPTQARILCVGAGTGEEMIHLAELFPQWQFTAVEPAAPMMAVCRHRAAQSGIAPRCTFHGGFLDTLPASEPFEAATCLLVSHGIVQREERSAFFRQIAQRMRAGGLLISSDLASDMASAEYASLIQVWVRMMKQPESGMSNEEAERFRASYGRTSSVLPPSQVASIIAEGGFERPVLFFQNLLIHAWYSRRAELG